MSKNYPHQPKKQSNSNELHTTDSQADVHSNSQDSNVQDNIQDSIQDNVQSNVQTKPETSRVRYPTNHIEDRTVDASTIHDSVSTAGTEKLQKALARMGLGSRRQMETVIKEGRVSINSTPATIGDRVGMGDEIRVDGRLIKYKSENEKRRRVIVYYKPEGEVCSANDPEGRPTVFDRLPKLTHDRWVMVGRLDINSSGLLLFTNDGELAHRLMHPSNQIEREYAVRVLGELTPAMASNLTTGVELEDGIAKFEDIQNGGGEGVNKWYHVKLTEGRNREVRRLFETQGLKVSRLIRTRYGTVSLPKELRTGRFIELDTRDIHDLTDSVSLRARRGTGLHGAAKRKSDRNKGKPMKARRVDQSSRLARRDQRDGDDTIYKGKERSGGEMSTAKSRKVNKTPIGGDDAARSNDTARTVHTSTKPKADSRSFSKRRGRS